MYFHISSEFYFHGTTKKRKVAKYKREYEKKNTHTQ